MPSTTASAKLLEPVLQLARHYRQPVGQDLPSQILEIAALPEQEFTKPGARFPASHYPQILDRLAEISDNPLIALSLGEATQPRMLGSIGFLMSTSPTLEQAYQRLIDYLPLLFEGAVLQMEQGVEETELTLELNDNAPHVVEYFLACLINWPRWLTGHQIPARYVRLTLPEPDNTQPYQQFFAAEVEFGAARNQLSLGSEYMNLACVDANSEMHHLHREFADSLLSKAALQNALTAQTRNLIRQQLAEGGGTVRREQIAASVGLSLRTLQRKLGQQGSNFQEIYDQTRREVCLQLIQRGQLSFGEISFQLGFSNQSAFQKAFKRWMGVAPSEYRAQVKPVEIGAVTPSSAPTQDTNWLEAEDRNEVLQRKLFGLSHFSRELLDWAAIAGEQFDLNILAQVTDNPLARLAIHFWPCEQLGLIVAQSVDSDKTLYRFADLALWQHFYGQISTSDREDHHRRFAESLLVTLPETPTLAELSAVLHHFSHTNSAALTPTLLQQQLKLALQATEIARSEHQYAKASGYMAQACILPEFEGLPNVNGRLLLCADLEIQAGEINAAEDRLRSLSQRPQTATETGRAALLRAQIQQQQGDLKNALSLLLNQLPQLDQALPEDSTTQLALLLKQLDFITEEFNAQALVDVQPLTDETQQICLKVLEQISLLARSQSQPLLAACAIGRMTEISLRHGRSDLTAFAFVSYAWVAGWFCADYSLAQTFSAQGMQLANRYGNLQQTDPEENSKIALSAALLHSSQVQHWFSPLDQVQTQLAQLETLAERNGQWLMQSECRQLRAQLDLFSDTPLAEQCAQLQQHHAQMLQLQQHHQANRLDRSIIRMIDCLTGDQPMCATPVYEDGWQAVAVITSALLLDEQPLWPQLYSWEASLENELPGYFCVSEALFCTALMRLIQGQQQSGLSKRRQLEVARLESRLEIWARHCPANFNGQLYLLQAEKARLDGSDPAQFFEQALSATEKQQFSFHRALIFERYADYLDAQDQRTLARFCFNEARWFYEKWGARAKVKQLAQRLALLAK